MYMSYFIDNQIEIEIVKKFIRKNKQERILWELSSPKNRENIAYHFDTPDIFSSECLYPVSLDEKWMMADYFERKGILQVYYIGMNYVGQLTVKEALEESCCDICIIYYGNGIGYYQGEEAKGGPPRYLLLEKGKKDMK